MYKKPLIIEPKEQAKHCVVWLHGLGADAHDFYSLVPYLKQAAQLPFVRWIFPYAPIMPVTINNGMKMPSWYDISNINLAKSTNMTDVKCSAEYVAALLFEQQAQEGQRDSSLHLAGFSQGGLIALSAAELVPVSSVLALSTYHPHADALRFFEYTQLAMIHGHADEVIPYSSARDTFDAIAHNHPENCVWHDFPMGHEVCVEEIQVIDQHFIKHCT